MIRRIKAMIHILKKSWVSWNPSNGMENCNGNPTENTESIVTPKPKAWPRSAVQKQIVTVSEKWKIRALPPVIQSFECFVLPKFRSWNYLWTTIVNSYANYRYRHWSEKGSTYSFSKAEVLCDLSTDFMSPLSNNLFTISIKIFSGLN